MEHIGLKHRYNVKHRYIDALIEGGFLVMTIPGKPNSRSQIGAATPSPDADTPPVEPPSASICSWVLTPKRLSEYLSFTLNICLAKSAKYST